MLGKNVILFRSMTRQFSSALYVTGDKAHKHFAILSPIIDFDNQLRYKNNLLSNIKTRQLPINLTEVEERWNYFKHIDSKKNSLEQTKNEIGQRISKLMKLPTNREVEKEIGKLKAHLKLVREDLKNVRNMSYAVEEGAALQVLNLPNILHPKTPQCEPLEIYSYLEKSNSKSESHLAIGHRKGYFKITNQSTCYLKSKAALFELAVQNCFCDELVNLSYTQYSNSDVVKSVVVEGCGTNPAKALTLEDIHCIHSDDVNRLHLVGASSIYSFMAYFTKHYVPISQFPIKVFCIGRNYRSVPNTCQIDIFNLSQSSEIGMFMAVMEDECGLEKIIDDIAILYRHLGLHFRIVLLPANQLNKAESLRLSIQMYSSHLSSYIEVGYISFYEDYLSKRLLLNSTHNGERRFPRVIGGNVINIHKVIGCALESKNIEQKSLFSDIFSK